MAVPPTRSPRAARIPRVPRLAGIARLGQAVALAGLALAASCRTAAPPPPPPPPAVEAQPAPETVSVLLRVTSSSLNVRRAAGTSSAVLAKLRRGERVALLAEDGDWLEVRLGDQRTGWVHRRYVSRDEPCQPDRAQPELLEGPPLSFSDGQAGEVVVEATFGADGRARAARVISDTTGVPELAARAVEEVRAMRFAPPVRRCRPQPFIYEYRRGF